MSFSHVLILRTWVIDWTYSLRAGIPVSFRERKHWKWHYEKHSIVEGNNGACNYWNDYGLEYRCMGRGRGVHLTKYGTLPYHDKAYIIVVHKTCHRRLHGHWQAATSLRWIGCVGTEWKFLVKTVSLKWLHLLNHLTNFDTVTSGWKLLMSTLTLALQPACRRSLTPGAKQPPSALSDNTQYITWKCDNTITY